jgi:hypothetical protein
MQKSNLPIRSIQKGWGQDAQWWRVGDKYAKILEELKEVSFGMGGVVHMRIYRVYDHEGDMVAEVEPNSNLTIIYKK